MKFEIQRFADSDFLKDNLTGFVPQEVSTDIIGDVAYGSSILRTATVEIMNSDSKKFSVFKNGVGAYWVDEADRIGTSVPDWEHPEIFAKKLAVIVLTTREKLNDSVIDVFGEVRPQIAEAFYKSIDSACLFGTGSPFAQSIYGAAMAAGNAVALGTNAKLDLDISDVMSLIEAKGYEVTGFVSNIAFKNQLRKLRDANGNQLYVQGITDKGGQRYDALYSLPVFFNRNNAWDASKAVCIGGNFKYAIVGIREQIQYEVLRESTLTTIKMDGEPLSLAERDMIGIRATMRLGFLPIKGDAFAVLVPAGTTIPASGGGTGSTETGSGTGSTETGSGTTP